MHYRIQVFLVLLASTAIPGFSQDTIRANVRGGNRGDGGKCTIEVDVDDVAEVQVRGDTARIRTLSGAPSRFRRFDCDGIMPTRPSEFRFTGVDGRGRQDLVQDPRNGGVAVIRIEDPKSGREGYTFDLEWRGGGNYGNGGGYNDRRGDGYNDRRGDGYNDRRGDGYNDRRNDRYDDRRGYGNGRNQNGSYTVSCSSDNGRRQYCEADVRGSVRMIRQFSRAACRQGETWGYDNRGIWVDRGCGADFEVGR